MSTLTDRLIDRGLQAFRCPAHGATLLFYRQAAPSETWVYCQRCRTWLCLLLQPIAFPEAACLQESA